MPDIDWNEIVQAFHQKMKFKNLEFTGINQMINEENDKQLLAAWNNSLAHQILEDNFPQYEKVKVELKELLQEIFN